MQLRGGGGGAGDLISLPIDADELGITFSSTSGEGCRPITLAEAAALVAGLRPLDPADDLYGAYRPLDLTQIQAQRAGGGLGGARPPRVRTFGEHGGGDR